MAITVETLEITSPVFAPNGRIPSCYSCDGNDVSPPLHISGLPDGVASLSLIIDDPDSPTGTWDHVILYNIKPDAVFAENVLPQGRFGLNSWGKLGYGGPCPGKGVHRYFFKVYALGKTLGLKEGATKKKLLSEMEGNILAYGELVGTYERETEKTD